MKKKKLLMPLAVMTLSCGLAAGLLTGCGHTHDYTEWDYDATGHWQVCVEDGEKSEKKPHVYGDDDKCECGLEKPAYGTASGNVKLLKLGNYVEDFTGVTIDTGDDDGIEVDYNSQTGAFSITNAQVGKSYHLTISKTGYMTYSTTLQAKKDENVVVGGTKGCVLQYDAFTHGSHVGNDWNGNYGTPSKIDKSHVNDAENSYFTINEGVGDFYVYSKDSYDSVTASVTYKDGVTWGCSDGHPTERGNQGLRLVFEDGKAAMIRIEKMEDGSFKAQWIGGKDWEEEPVKEEVWDFGTGEANFSPFSSELETKYKDEGVELKLVRNGGIVYAYVDGQKAGEQVLPVEYASQKCRVALTAACVNGGQKIPFSISETLPEWDESTVTLNKDNVPDVAGVNVSLDRTSCRLGDKVTLSVEFPAEEYILGEITVNKQSVLDNYKDGKVSFVALEQNEVVVTILQKQFADVDVAVTGRKYDVKGNSLEGKEITLKGKGGLEDVTFTVTNGRISKEHIVQGTYTADFAGYKPVTVVIGEHGIENAIIFEYDGFESLYWGWDWDKVNLDKANLGEFGYDGQPATTFNVTTKDFYGDVAVSLDFKQSNSTNSGAYLQGIEFTFGDGKVAVFGINLGEGKVQFRPCPWKKESVWGTTPSGGDFWVEIYLTEAEKTAFCSSDGLPITLVRKGGLLYVLINDRCANVTELPAAYRTEKAKVGFYAADGAANAKFTYNITTELPSLASTVQVNVDKPTGATEATVTANKNSCTLGDTVELTVNCPAGYILTKLEVNGRDLGGGLNDGKVTFVADMATMTVTVEFVAGELKEVEINASGIGLNNSAVNLDGKELTLQLKGSAARYKATVQNGKISAELPVGKTLVVSLDGFYDCEITVPADGTVEDGISLSKVIFQYNIINESENNIFGKDPVSVAGDSTKAATEGVIKSVKNGKIYEWTVDKFDDIAFTVTLKNGNGNQGIVLRSGWQKDVRVRFEGNKAQWIGGDKGGWWWGTSCIHDKWDFGGGEEYANSMSAALLAKYNGDGLELTLARKGGTVYALIDGKIYSAQLLGEWANEKVMFAFFAEDAKEGYNIPFKFEDVDTVLERACAAVGTDLTAYFGAWTEEENTLKVSGSGYAEFKAEAGTVKESAVMKLSAANGGDQGFMYRFPDGKYIAVRYQNNGGNYKVQYTMDTVLIMGGSLKNWTDFLMTDDEKKAFDTTGIDLKFVRNGNEFRVYLGEKLVDTATLDEKYAAMDGIMGIMVWNGKNAAFTYSHTTGDAAVPEETAE